MAESAPPASEPVDKQKRIPNNYAKLLELEQPEEELRKCLEKFVTDIPPEKIDREKLAEGGGLVVSPTGTAYLFLNVAREHPSMLICGKPAVDWVPLYLGPAPPISPVEAKTCGLISNELSYCAVAAAYHQDEAWVDRFLSHLPALTARDSPKENDELVYGRAGTLYLLRLMAHWCPSAASKITPWYGPVITTILSHGPPWIFAGSDYLGAGHGRAGILVQILLSEPSYAGTLEPLLASILDLQLPNGNFPSYLPMPGKEPRDYLVQWCHGAPGIIQTLRIARPHYPSLHARIDAAIELARKHVWEKGLICKTPNQCHGITGNALVAFPPGPQRRHFLAHTTQEGVLKGEREGFWESADYEFPYSLYFGSVSRAVGLLWSEKEEGVFMGYDDV